MTPLCGACPGKCGSPAPSARRKGGHAHHGPENCLRPRSTWQTRAPHARAVNVPSNGLHGLPQRQAWHHTRHGPDQARTRFNGPGIGHRRHDGRDGLRNRNLAGMFSPPLRPPASQGSPEPPAARPRAQVPPYRDQREDHQMHRQDVKVVRHTDHGQSPVWFGPVLSRNG